MRLSIIADLSGYLYFDLNKISRDQYGPYYVTIEMPDCYGFYHDYLDQKICPICQEDYDFNKDSISLLRCGHIFHSICIEKYQDLNYQNFICKCPVCKREYDIEYEKYKFDYRPYWSLMKELEISEMHFINIFGIKHGKNIKIIKRI